MEGLMASHDRLLYSISATTRAPRPGERDHVDYFFRERDEFQRGVHQHAFLEWREYNGNLYGTPRSFIEEKLRDGYNVVSKPEVNGALAIKEQFSDAVLIFIVPDKFSYLRSRLETRRTETNEQIAARLEIAHDEFKFITGIRLSRDQRGSSAAASGRRPRGDRAGRTVPHPSRPRHPPQRIGRQLT